MVAKLTAAGVVDLTCCLSNEQSWQRCGTRDLKVLREGGGGTGITKQVQHVKNQRQSVQKRVKEGMKDRTVGRSRSLTPCACEGDLADAPLQTSFTFNEVAGLQVHNQQEYKLVVDRAFVDIFRWHQSLHAMVLHMGATKNEAHFVVHVVFEHKWWLCDYTTVKGASAQGPSGARDRNMNMHARSMPSDMCMTTLAPLPHGCSNE